MVSRYDVALEILNVLGLNNKIMLYKVYDDHFKQAFFAPRPHSETLINRKLELRGLNKMRNWKECLKEYVEKDWLPELKEKCPGLFDNTPRK